MERFRTPVTIPHSAETISYTTPCLLMGSCFSDEIGRRMEQEKFPVLLNPFGTLFNPASIHDNLLMLLEGSFPAEMLREYQDQWFSFSHSTAFTRTDREECLTLLETSVREASAWLRKCRYLILTFGTAWAYLWENNGTRVANCHKIPARYFRRELLSPETITGLYDELLHTLRAEFPQLQVIFTVSPVRHWKDGAVDNQLSKSVLHVAIHNLLKNHGGLHYFPSYEIFMDELRDYRFYAADMLHPSEQGTDYVWERFCDTWLDAGTKITRAGVEALVRAAGHRPVRNDSPELKKFALNTLKQIDQLTQSYPYLDFSREIARLKGLLQ
jgi:hypothetical protein